MALQPLWTFTAFSLSLSIHSRQESFDGGSARWKAATYTQNNTNRINASSRIRTHNSSVREGRDSSRIRLRDHSHQT
jgi:hypothetical protein